MIELGLALGRLDAIEPVLTGDGRAALALSWLMAG
jgi:hypothetical protein